MHFGKEHYSGVKANSIIIERCPPHFALRSATAHRPPLP